MKLVLGALVMFAAAVTLYWLPVLLVALVGFPYLVVLLALVVPWILLLLLLTFRAFRARRRGPD